jgi:hypothetical protein
MGTTGILRSRHLFGQCVIDLFIVADAAQVSGFRLVRMMRPDTSGLPDIAKSISNLVQDWWDCRLS